MITAAGPSSPIRCREQAIGHQVLKEIAGDTTVDKVQQATGADLIVDATPGIFG